MPGEVLVVTSGKGGVGKTTTAVNLAIALRQQGHSTVVLDADLGMSNVGAFLSLDAATTLHDVLARDATTTEAIVEIESGIGFVFGDRSLEGFADADPARLDDVVEELKSQYRYVLVDTGGSLTYEGVYPMELADEILLVTSPVPAAIADTKKSKRLADRLNIPVRGVIVTHTTGDTNPESVASELDVDFLGDVPADDAVVESATKRQPVVAYAPESAATIAYYRIAERLSGSTPGELEPLDTATKPSEMGTEAPLSDGAATDGPGEESSTAARSDTETVETEASDGSENRAIDGDESGDAGEATTDGEATPDGEKTTGSDSDSDPERSATTGFFGRLLGRIR